MSPNVETNGSMSQKQEPFFEWYSALDIEVKVFVPGNHSLAVEQGIVSPDQYPAIRFLIHDQTELGGMKVFGTPYTPKYFNWAYMRDRSDLDIVWQSISEEVDVLISHGPPKGYLDVTRDLETNDRIHV
jgi:hypothetical protein